MSSIARNSGRILASLLCMCFMIATSCCASKSPVEHANSTGAERDTLTQISTINALMAGDYDGSISCGDLKQYGDFGIGTFEALDGEMIVLGGKIYQVNSDGAVNVVSDSLGVPFAAVTYYENDKQAILTPDINFIEFQKFVDDIIPSKNVFYALKVDGTFSYIKTRSVPKQEKPYPILSEVTQKQSVFEFNNISGTIVGFRCPQYVNGVNVPGYHLHFLTSDSKSGGHVLEFTLKNGTLSTDYTSEFRMILPDLGNDFHKLDFSQDKQSELEKVEK